MQTLTRALIDPDTLDPPMTQLREFTARDPGQRLDRFLADLCEDLSRSRIKRLIAQGGVRVDGRTSDAGYRLKPGQLVELSVPEPVPTHMLAQDMPLAIVFEDEWLIVVDKPAGMPVHPGPGHPDSTLVNAVLGLRPQVEGVGGVMRPGLVHRLDKDSSGLLVLAKTDAAHAALSGQMKARQFAKGYLALVHGALSPPEAVIDAPIGRDPTNRKRMAVAAAGKSAVTVYSTESSYPKHTLARVTPETGRTHQIRVHFASIGYPLVGDGLYGRPDPDLPRHFLHADRIGFRHPISDKPLEFRSGLPDELQRFVDSLSG